MAETESEYFSPYRADGKLFGFVCVVTGTDGPIGQAIVAELAGTATQHNPSTYEHHA